MPKRTSSGGKTAPSPPPRPKQALATIDLARLPGLPLGELRVIWAQHMGRTPPPSQKQVLVRQLAWTVQEREHGGLDERTRRLLDAAVSLARREMEAGSKGPAASTSSESSRRRAKPGTKGSTILLPRELPPAARLVRVWPAGSKNVHEVTVLGDGRGFQYRDRTFTNLSAIALAITGSKWSGPRFFGLSSRRSKPLGDVGS